jgi:hypothetical protein
VRPLAAACLVATLVLAGCGGSERTIDTPKTVALLHQAGFRHLSVISNRKAYEQLLRRQRNPNPAEAAKKALDADTIMVLGGPFPFLRLLVYRAPSEGFAKRIERESSRAALLKQLAALRRRYPRYLPPGFDLRRFRTERVCNVVLSSYNPTRNRVLAARFDRAVGLVKDAC